MALLRHGSWLPLLALLGGGCADSGEPGAFSLEAYDRAVVCDEASGDCLDARGDVAAPEPLSGVAFVGQLASQTEGGTYLYLELQRLDGTLGVLELDVPRHGGLQHVLYVELEPTGVEIFRSQRATGIVELTAPGCSCLGGRFELQLEDDGAARNPTRRLSRGLFSRGAGFCHPGRTARIGTGLLVRQLACPPRPRARQPSYPTAAGGGAGYYYPADPVEVGCGVEAEPDPYYPPYEDDGGCGGDEPPDDGGDGCDGGDDGYDSSGGCEGDSSAGDGCDSGGDYSGGNGCDSGDSGGASGCSDSGSDCEGDALAAVKRCGPRGRCRPGARRRPPLLGVTLPVILPALLLTHLRRRRRRRMPRGLRGPTA